MVISFCIHIEQGTVPLIFYSILAQCSLKFYDLCAKKTLAFGTQIIYWGRALKYRLCPDFFILERNPKKNNLQNPESLC